MNAIEIKGLRKTYAPSKKYPEKIALKDVDLDIPKGSLFALLGPNGAGKSTLINIMAGLVNKTAGEVNLWGVDLDQDARNAKNAIGVVPQEINFDPFFTPAQLLDIQAGLYGVPTSERRTKELLDLVGLADKANAYTRSLSGGMRRRLMVAKAMVHNPPILVLDEPTAGVDVELRQMLWENVKKLNREGKTILLTTHYLEEAEQLCDQIAIINNGEIIANESKDTLLGRLKDKAVVVRVDRAVETIPESLKPFRPSQPNSRTLVISYSPSDTPVGKILALIQGAGYEIVDVATQKSDLENVFVQLTRAA
ncbi:MAG: ATP-binding cassette domain-containing protein [Alphaproteobacteria bacterium]|nr:ATP-binding cassette domain-containing protein [Alphaproteobacteria bacterium]